MPFLCYATKQTAPAQAHCVLPSPWRSIVSSSNQPKPFPSSLLSPTRCKASQAQGMLLERNVHSTSNQCTAAETCLNMCVSQEGQSNHEEGSFNVRSLLLWCVLGLHSKRRSLDNSSRAAGSLESDATSLAQASASGRLTRRMLRPQVFAEKMW